MKFFIVIFFIISLNLLSNIFDYNNFSYLPSLSAFKNYDELNFFYKDTAKETGLNLKYDFISISAKYDIKKSKTLYSLSSYYKVNKNLSFGSRFYLKSIKNYPLELDLTFKSKYLYISYSHIFNYEKINDSYKNFTAFAIFPNNYFMPYAYLTQKENDFFNAENWNYTLGISFLNTAPVSFAYEYQKINKISYHKLYLNANISYLNTGIKTLNKNIDEFYLSIRNKEKKNSFFANENYYLKIKLNGKLPESSSGGITDGTKYSFTDLTYILKKALKDKYIKGILFEITKPSLSLSQAEELTKILNTPSPKKYITYIKSNSLGDYILALNSQKTIIHPASSLNINGPEITMLFYKDFFKFFGIKFYFYKRSEYKTAPEIYTNSQPSKYSKSEINKILNTIKEHIESILKQKLNIDSTKISDLPDNSPYFSVRALRKNLVNKISYIDEIENHLKKQGITIISPLVYKNLNIKDFLYKPKDKIAILNISGIISEYKGIFLGFKENYEKIIINSIKKIKNNPEIKGVIIRINSPGGSGIVSEDFYHALKILKKSKPVYVSIGAMGASGGYYIAVAGDKIFADKTSIVGSIGVFSGKMVIKDLLKKLKINIFTKTIWKNDNLYSVYSEPSENQSEKMDNDVEDFYDLFLSRVSENRNISFEKLKNKTARGKIYLGEEAKKLGLIDEIGGLYDAISLLIKDNSLSESYELIVFPERKGILYELVGEDKKLLYNLTTLYQLINSKNILLWDYEINF